MVGKNNTGKVQFWLKKKKGVLHPELQLILKSQKILKSILKSHIISGRILGEAKAGIPHAQLGEVWKFPFYCCDLTGITGRKNRQVYKLISMDLHPWDGARIGNVPVVLGLGIFFPDELSTSRLGPKSPIFYLSLEKKIWKAWKGTGTGTQQGRSGGAAMYGSSSKKWERTFFRSPLSHILGFKGCRNSTKISILILPPPSEFRPWEEELFSFGYFQFLLPLEKSSSSKPLSAESSPSHPLAFQRFSMENLGVFSMERNLQVPSAAAMPDFSLESGAFCHLSILRLFPWV